MNALAEIANSNATPFAASIIGVYTAGILTILSVVLGVVLTHELRQRAARRVIETARAHQQENLVNWVRWMSAQLLQVQVKVGIDPPVNPFVSGGPTP